MWGTTHESRRKPPAVSFIIPVYNEGDIIIQNLDALCSFMEKESYELIVCDDCSSDDTYLKLREAVTKNPSISLLHFNRRIGKGGTIKKAIKMAKSRTVLIMDADLSTDLNYIPMFMKHVINDCSIVIAERSVSDRCTQGYFRVMLSLGYNALVRFFFRTGIKDHQCGFKGMRRDIAKLLASKIVNNGFLFDTELIVTAKKLGITIKTIKVKWRETRTNKSSSIQWLKTALTMMKDLVRLRLKSVK